MKYRPSPPLILLRDFVRSFSMNGFAGAIGDFGKNVLRLFRKHGFGGSFKLFLRSGPHSTVDATTVQAHPFDLRHGTDTSGPISGAYFSAISLSSIYTTGYEGATPSALTQALAALPIRFEEFAFVDIGCGKGRALLIAAQFPFRQLLGVELSTEFCEIARANAATAPADVDRISILNQDAADLAYPNVPIVIFLFNPFLAPGLRRVLKNLERQLRVSPRPVYLLYEMNPRYTKVLEAFPFLKEISDTSYPFSSEDAASDSMGRSEENFTLYSVDLASFSQVH